MLSKRLPIVSITKGTQFVNRIVKNSFFSSFHLIVNGFPLFADPFNSISHQTLLHIIRSQFHPPLRLPFPFSLNPPSSPPTPSPLLLPIHNHPTTCNNQTRNQTPTEDPIHTPPSKSPPPINSNPQSTHKETKTAFPPVFIILHYEQLACAS